MKPSVHLSLSRAEHSWQPSALTRVHQEEHGVMRVKKVLQNLDIPLRLLFRTWRNRMTWHWNRERHTFSVLMRSTLAPFPERPKTKRRVGAYSPGKYLPQPRRGRLGFGL